MGNVSSIVVNSGQAGINYYFGVQPITIGGEVYTDSNANGQLNTGETGISGVTVTLSGTNGGGQSITATTTTGSGGTYSFTKDSNGNLLLPGTYTITETALGGTYILGAANLGTVGGSSDGTVASQTQISGIGLTSGQSGINYNFGDYQPVTLAGMAYVDANKSGAFDAGDAGVAGVTLTLSGTNGQGQTVTATTTTGTGGTYSFSTDSNAHRADSRHLHDHRDPAEQLRGRERLGGHGQWQRRRRRLPWQGQLDRRDLRPGRHQLQLRRLSRSRSPASSTLTATPMA